MVILRSYTSNSILGTALIALAMPVSGMAAPRCEPRIITHANLTTWTQPLARTVTLRAGAVSLKEALDKLAATANVRVSYSAELLPLDRKICATYHTAPVGDVLSDLLRGVGVEPVVAGADHIVLTPSAMRAAADVPQSPVYPLTPLVAQATTLDHTQPQTNFAYSYITAREAVQQGSIAQAINAMVPGYWAWQSGSFATLFSARGASSFGLSSPKIYIDGIEVANPLLASQIAPENVERIEVIRGPQGAALYGADALNGVTNIVTRHDWAGAGMPRLRVRSGLALSNSEFTGSAGVGQDHAIALQFGTRARSGNLNFGAGTVGEYLPDAYARHLSADGSVRLVGRRTLVSASARLFTQAAANPASLLTPPTVNSVTPLSMQQFTAGFKTIFRQSAAITHAIVLGVDGYHLGNTPADSTTPLSAADSVLRAWDTGVRTTLRLSSVAQLGKNENARGTITIAAERSGLHQDGDGITSTTNGEFALVGRHPAGPQYDHEMTPEGAPTQIAEYEQSRVSNGLSAHIDATLLRRVSINGGMRLEQDNVNGTSGGTAALPMLGASYRAGNEDFSVKLRAAYGKAVRWPEMRRFDGTYAQTHVSRPILSPEQQSGIESGVDVTYRQMIGVQVTHYDQTASGLSQIVALAAPPPSGTQQHGTQYSPPRYAIQNVGEIGNRGWELQGYVRHGPLSLTGTMALTDSRVLRVANGYTGDMRAGDRTLSVPARTVSLSGTWSGPDWSTSFTAARAFDWVNYDRAALAKLDEQPAGNDLRAYWQNYDGFTHLRATLTHNLNRGFTILLAGDNLLDQQVGEPDNLTVVPGRTFSLGIRAAF